jgi:hypothetical protein
VANSRPVRQNNRFFVIMFVLMIVGGFCAVGYWQTYDLKCTYGTKQWTFAAFPPQFKCPSLD